MKGITILVAVAAISATIACIWLAGKGSLQSETRDRATVHGAQAGYGERAVAQQELVSEAPPFEEGEPDGVSSQPDSPLSPDPHILRRNVAQLETAQPCLGAANLLRVVMNAVADILHAEGQGTPLEEGSTVSPGAIDSADRRAIVRQAWDGAWLYTAQRDRFPVLFDLMEADRSGAVPSPELCAEARQLAQEADAAYLSKNPSHSRPIGSANPINKESPR